MPKDLAFGQRAISRIVRDLEHPKELEHDFAEAILQQAKRNASSRPTPQAPMAADILTVEGASIGPSAGGPAADVGIGSEFGSVLYPQFQKNPNPRGYWLYPATRDSGVLQRADKSLEEVLQDAIRAA